MKFIIYNNNINQYIAIRISRALNKSTMTRISKLNDLWSTYYGKYNNGIKSYYNDNIAK